MTRSRFDRVKDYLENVQKARIAMAAQGLGLVHFDREVEQHVARELSYDEKEQDEKSDGSSPRERFYNAMTFEEWRRARNDWRAQGEAPLVDAPLDRLDVVAPETDANGDRGSGKGWMGTSTGKKFWPLAPRPEDVDVRDIARGLAMTCRYGGQVKRYYSVAEHCVLVSRHVAPELALKALFHDCAEAYIGDMIRPLKHQSEMAAFRTAEREIEACINLALGLNVSHAEHDAIKVIDDRILIDEICALSVRPDYYLSTPLLKDKQALGVTIVGFGPASAEEQFLVRYHELTSRAHVWGGSCFCVNNGCTRRISDPPSACPSDGDPL